MPPLPPVPGVIRTHISYNLETANPAGTRFFMSYTGGPPNAGDLNTWCADVGTQWATAFAAHMPTGYSISAVDAIDLATSSGNVGHDGTSHAGTGAAGALPAGTCTVLDFLFSLHYRGGKPRAYLPIGLAGDQQDGATWKTTYVSAITTAATSFFTALEALSFGSFSISHHVNVSYYSGKDTNQPPTGHWRGPGFPYPPLKRTVPQVTNITGYRPATIIGSQRRRLRLG